jgi:hypothetical protein
VVAAFPQVSVRCEADHTRASRRQLACGVFLKGRPHEEIRLPTRIGPSIGRSSCCCQLVCCHQPHRPNRSCRPSCIPALAIAASRSTAPPALAIVAADFFLFVPNMVADSCRQRLSGAAPDRVAGARCGRSSWSCGRQGAHSRRRAPAWRRFHSRSESRRRRRSSRTRTWSGPMPKAAPHSMARLSKRDRWAGIMPCPFL